MLLKGTGFIVKDFCNFEIQKCLGDQALFDYFSNELRHSKSGLTSQNRLFLVISDRERHDMPSGLDFCADSELV